MTFLEAVDLLLAGRMVARSSWAGDSFVFRQVPSTIPITTVPKMTSLPEPVRAEFLARGADLRYRNQFALVDKTNEIVGWSPSPSDVLALDWCEYAGKAAHSGQ